MAANSAVEIRFGAPENVLEVQVGTVTALPTESPTV